MKITIVLNDGANYMRDSIHDVLHVDFSVVQEEIRDESKDIRADAIDSSCS